MHSYVILNVRILDIICQRHRLKKTALARNVVFAIIIIIYLIHNNYISLDKNKRQSKYISGGNVSDRDKNIKLLCTSSREFFISKKP